MPKDAKESDGPKRPLSSYMLFAKATRAKVVSDNPGIAPKDVMSKLGELWKGLSDKEKKPFEAQAEEAKAEYVAAGGGAKPRAKKEKAAKDGDAPKRSNPYMNFSKAKRAEVQAANPGMKITEISKVLGQEWAKLSDEEKAEYK